MSDELGPNARNVLDALREAETPSASALDRGLVRLESELGLGVTGTGAAATAAGSAGSGGVGTGLIVGALAVAGLGGALALFLARPWAGPTPEEVRVEAPAVVHAADEEPNAPPVAGHAAVEVEAEPVLPPEEEPRAELDALEPASTVPEATESEPEASERNPRPRKKARSKADASEATSPKDEAEDGTDLSEELRLLGKADRAIKKGMPGLALDHLLEHGKRFPDSKLSHERTLTRVRALCAAGDGEGARREADAYLAEHPSSHLADKVRKACPEG